VRPAAIETCLSRRVQEKSSYLYLGLMEETTRSGRMVRNSFCHHDKQQEQRGGSRKLQHLLRKV
jgi:hypothetical protein